MTVVRELLSYISADHSLDYWADVGLSHAIALADRLCDDDWIALSHTWQTLASMAQVRLAEVLGETTSQNDHTVSMLLAMLSVSEGELAETSLDAMSLLQQRSPDRIDGERLRRALKDFKPAGKLGSLILNSLSQRIG